MGDVYRAEDTKLKREVAIKVLPEAFARDEERMKRFEREAQVLASLNHPNIAAIYGLVEVDGVHALVLELVEGPTLAERLAEGPIPLDEALEIARQIGEALEEAHRKGIVHRDLKPANVKLTPEGKVQVLDVGLAKAFAAAASEVPSPELSQLPTLTRQTVAGVVLGTAAYLSPEQARGKTVDKRTDIWVFGVVLFEMLTGRPLFMGETVSDVLAAVLRAEVDWAKLPTETPPGLRRLLRRTLAREPSERLHDIADARLELRELQEEDHPPTPSPPMRPSRTTIAALLLGAASLGGVIAWTAKPDRAKGTTSVRFALPLPAAFPPDYQVKGSPIALSSDGSHLAFASSRDGRYIRPMDPLDFRHIEGTDGAHGPFFSPDGEWLSMVLCWRKAQENLTCEKRCSLYATRRMDEEESGATTEPFSLLPIIRPESSASAPRGAHHRN